MNKTSTTTKINIEDLIRLPIKDNIEFRKPVKIDYEKIVGLPIKNDIVEYKAKIYDPTTGLPIDP